MVFTTVFSIICSIFDTVILYIYLTKVLGRKKDSVPTSVYILAFILCEAALYCLTVYFDSIHSNMRVYITIPFSLITTFLLTLLHNGRLRHKLFVSLSFQIYATLAETVVYILLLCLPQSISETLLSTDYYGAFCSKIVLFILLNITILLWNRKEQNYSLPYTILILIMPIMTLVALMAFSFQADMTTTRAIFSLIGMSGILFANITNYILLDNVLKVYELNQTKLQLDRQLEYQANKYQQISTIYRNSRSLIHDMKKHFFFIQSCVDSKEYETIHPYIQESIQNIEQTHNRVNTGNLVIDAFVSNHMSIAEQENIEFLCDIQVFNNNIEIANYDLSIILGNLLDNSLNACRKIQMPASRQISVQIFTTNMELVIHIANSVGGTPIENEISSQNLYHGFGTKNIENIAKKYMGTYTHYVEAEQYHSIVTIPCHIEH